MENLDVSVLGGILFMEINDMTCQFDQPNTNCELVTPLPMSADPKPMQTEMNTCPSQTPKVNSNLAWGVY